MATRKAVLYLSRAFSSKTKARLQKPPPAKLPAGDKNATSAAASPAASAGPQQSTRLANAGPSGASAAASPATPGAGSQQAAREASAAPSAHAASTGPQHPLQGASAGAGGLRGSVPGHTPGSAPAPPAGGSAQQPKVAVVDANKSVEFPGQGPAAGPKDASAAAAPARMPVAGPSKAAAAENAGQPQAAGGSASSAPLTATRPLREASRSVDTAGQPTAIPQPPTAAIPMRSPAMPAAGGPLQDHKLAPATPSPQGATCPIDSLATGASPQVPKPTPAGSAVSGAPQGPKSTPAASPPQGATSPIDSPATGASPWVQKPTPAGSAVSGSPQGPKPTPAAPPTQGATSPIDSPGTGASPRVPKPTPAGSAVSSPPQGAKPTPAAPPPPPKPQPVAPAAQATPAAGAGAPPPKPQHFFNGRVPPGAAAARSGGPAAAVPPPGAQSGPQVGPALVLAGLAGAGGLIYYYTTLRMAGSEGSDPRPNDSGPAPRPPAPPEEHTNPENGRGGASGLPGGDGPSTAELLQDAPPQEGQGGSARSREDFYTDEFAMEVGVPGEAAEADHFETPPDWGALAGPPAKEAPEGGGQEGGMHPSAQPEPEHQREPAPEPEPERKPEGAVEASDSKREAVPVSGGDGQAAGQPPEQSVAKAINTLERELVAAARQVERFYEQGRPVGLEDPLPAAAELGSLLDEVGTGHWRHLPDEAGEPAAAAAGLDDSPESTTKAAQGDMGVDAGVPGVGEDISGAALMRRALDAGRGEGDWERYRLALQQADADAALLAQLLRDARAQHQAELEKAQAATERQAAEASQLRSELRNAANDFIGELQHARARADADREAALQRQAQRLGAEAEAAAARERVERMRDVDKVRLKLGGLGRAFAARAEGAQAAASARALSMGAFALDAAMDAGVPLGPAADAARSAAGSDPLAIAALDSLPPSVLAEGAPTRQELAARWARFARSAHTLSHLPEGSGGPFSLMLAGLAARLKIWDVAALGSGSAGGTGGGPACALAAAEAALGAGNLVGAAAIAESGLCGTAAAGPAARWASAARSRAAAEQAARLLQAHAAVLAVGASDAAA